MPDRREFLRAIGGSAAAVATAGCSQLFGPDVGVETPDESVVGAPLGVSLSEVRQDADVTLRVSATDARDAEFVGEFAVTADGTVAGPAEGEPPVAAATVTDNSDPPDDPAVADTSGDLRMPLAALTPREGETVEGRFTALTPDVFKESVDLEVVARVGGRETDATTVTRRLVAPDVSAEDVADHDLVGTLYEPPGDGPSPGVILLHGSAGTRPTGFASLLASHGYAALALQYFGGPGLPDALYDIPLEYFLRAVLWLTRREGVHDDRLGLVGFSRGVEPALLIGARLNRPTAVAGYVGSGLVAGPHSPDGADVGDAAPWTRNGRPVIPADPLLEVDGRVREAPRLPSAIGEGVDSLRSTVNADRVAIPVEDIDGPVTLLTGQADQVWNSPVRSEYAVDRLRRHGHDHPYVHATYEGAGHVISYPYIEFAGSGGGEPVPNANAAADGFVRTLDALARGLRD